ncbi:MAG: HEAT repeat domain-containing protein [Verrucomicrobiota bacterium]
MAAMAAAGPYEQQIEEQLAKLADASSSVRVRAAEALGFLRARQAGPRLVTCLEDPSPKVRRQAVLALGWCGERSAVAPLLQHLDDSDWLTRQGAQVALTALTGLEFPFDALAPAAVRQQQAEAWRTWWRSVPADGIPDEVRALLQKSRTRTTAPWQMTASSTYRGPLEVLIDGQLGPGYWQTKNVPVPQWCQLDLGTTQQVERVTVHQYGAGYCVTNYDVATSLDGNQFMTVASGQKLTPVTWDIPFASRPARFVRITSLGSENKQFPTTFREIEINGQSAVAKDPETDWQRERGLRALGALGGAGATALVLQNLGAVPANDQASRPAVRAGLRALGQLGEAKGRDYLVTQLGNPFWARAAAEALGDTGDRRVVGPLLAAYARFAKLLNGKNPAEVPVDDDMKFPSDDRMLETPYWIIHALSRLPLDDPQDRETLTALAPRLMANLPGDHDTFVLYQPEVAHRLTRHLLMVAGLRQEAAEQAFTQLGMARRVDNPRPDLAWPVFPAERMATWLPCVCTDAADLPRLTALLEHTNGWVRINAAKALGWLGDARAVAPLARILAEAKAEGDYGWSRTFKDEEFNDPCPRWREAFLRALGLLKATPHTALMAKIMDDEKSVLEVRLAAAQALADLGTPETLALLRRAAATHPYGTVRNAAQDALRANGGPGPEETFRPVTEVHREASAVTGAGNLPGIYGTNFNALLFIKGANDLPNTPQTVEQADRWRQTYVVTDEGPSYRPGDNLYLLSPPQPDGKVTRLTPFTNGWIGEPELSWDARQVVFTRREADSLWWHIWIMNIDGTGLRQLTHGAYHYVGPVFLPDGRILCASSHTGIRDEYHGYLCTALGILSADGASFQPIATNIGRDNEPAILPDGRIVFSRLEVFYSRNKTELVLHAMHPDGTRDTVIYGPERRAFWRALDHGQPGPDDGQEAPLTHRVLRMTQPQGMPDGRIVVATQGGLALVGSRDGEQLICPDFKTRAYTTPMPLADGTILCATTLKTPDRKKVDLGIYRLDPRSGHLQLIYNDPTTADYEARPVIARRPPPALATDSPTESSGRMLCASVFNTQEPEVRRRGRLIRLVEGMPVPSRHATHTGPDPVWKNHGGTQGRVLGTVPLAADGSFYLELPADRLVHLQVLDCDRRVINNQRTWIYARPGETKACAGCHENAQTTQLPVGLPQALQGGPVRCMPEPGQFTYRAKAWFKGSLPAEIEERTRTVHAVNLLAR